MTDMLSAKRGTRVKIGATLDPDLVAAVDLYVTSNPGLDRSTVIDDALRLWHARQQELAMERQLLEDAGRDDAERSGWKTIRKEAAKRRFNARS